MQTPPTSPLCPARMAGQGHSTQPCPQSRQGSCDTAKSHRRLKQPSGSTQTHQVFSPQLRSWETPGEPGRQASCVIRHSSSGMRAHNSTRVSSTAFKGMHALKFPADSGLLFALPSQPGPAALKAFQANPEVALGLAALVCTCAVLGGCSGRVTEGFLLFIN